MSEEYKLIRDLDYEYGIIGWSIGRAGINKWVVSINEKLPHQDWSASGRTPTEAIKSALERVRVTNE